MSPFFCSLGTSYITFPPRWSSDLQIKTRSKGRGKTRLVTEFKTLRIRSVGLRTALRSPSCASPAFQRLFCQQQTLGAFLEASLVSSVPKFQPCFRRFLCALAQTCRRVFSPWRSLSRSNGLVICNTRINSGSARQLLFYFHLTCGANFSTNPFTPFCHDFTTISAQKWIFDPDIPTNSPSSLVWGGACSFGVCATYFVLGFLCGGQCCVCGVGKSLSDGISPVWRKQTTGSPAWILQQNGGNPGGLPSLAPATHGATECQLRDSRRAEKQKGGGLGTV